MNNYFDKDAINLITVIQDDSGVMLTLAERIYVHFIVSGFKSIGVWDKIKALYGFVGGTAEAHRWNWKDMRDLPAAFRLTFHNGISHSGFGISAIKENKQYVRTYFVANLINKDSHHFSINPYSYGSGYTFGGFYSGGSGSPALRSSINTNGFTSLTETTTPYSSSPDFTKLLLLNRNSSNKSYIINRGIIVGEQNISSVQPTNNTEYRFFNRNVYVSSDIYGNDPALYVTGTISFASIGNGLTDQQAIQMSHIIYTAQGILNRQ